MLNKRLLIGFLCVLFGCGQTTPPQNSVAELADTLKGMEGRDPEEPVDIQALQKERIDTTLSFAGGHTVTLRETEDTFSGEYFLEQRIIDSLSAPYNNRHLEARAIETYLSAHDQEYVRRDSSGLHVKLANGQWKLVTVDPSLDEADHTFEYFFEEYGFYSVRTQWGEGNGFTLVNFQNGDMTRVWGRPYFSPSGRYVITVSVDLEAHYSQNGFQLFRQKNGQLELLGSFEPEEWGPYSAKWIDDTTVLLKNEQMETYEGELEYVDFFREVKIDEPLFEVDQEEPLVISDPYQTIKRIFDTYNQFQESTDSPANLDSLKQALHLLERSEVDEETLTLVINLWMYYSVTDFHTQKYTTNVLKAHKDQSILAIRNRIENKMEWEREGGAPYAELPRLLEYIQSQEP